MLALLLLGALAPAGLGLPAPADPLPSGGQCVGLECFALFRGPATFAAAGQACGRLRGHLMTVRSSVAAEVISLLLGGAGGLGPRLWIGLERPAGCGGAEPRGPLRGFQWVTGDNRTSYSAWARPAGAGAGVGAEPGAPCGALCVAVSAAPAGPAWEEQSCALPAAGFLCEFHFAASCRPLALAAGLEASYATPFGARGADFQALPVGSLAAVAALDVRLECAAPPGAAEGRWGRGAPGAWHCGVDNGGCEHECSPGAAGPRCSCPGRAAPQPDGRTCGPAPPCPGPCEHFCVARAEPPGAYVCMCEAGFELAADGHGCEDVDDCALSPGPCPQRCANTRGGFECLCHAGFELRDGECVPPPDPCLGSRCEFECRPEGEAGYRCVCAEGFAPVPSEPHRCQLFCNQTACPADCDPHSPGSCQCPDGYILDEGAVCADIDECSSGYCAHACRNLPGSYECLCAPGEADCKPEPQPGAGGGGAGEDGSGEPPAGPAPQPTARSPPAGPLPSGALAGVSVACLCLVAALLALLCHLRKKQGAARGELDYKGGSPAREVVLQRVRPGRTLQTL